MRLVSLILGCLHIPVGGLMLCGSLFRLAHLSPESPLWPDLLGMVVLGIIPLSLGIVLLRGRIQFSEICGGLLMELGVAMIYGFVMARAFTKSPRPLWPDLAAVSLVGALPLVTGILLFGQRSASAKTVLKVICLVCVTMFVLSVASYYLLPPDISAPLNIVAATGLVGGVLCGIGWAIAHFSERPSSRKRRSTRSSSTIPTR